MCRLIAYLGHPIALDEVLLKPSNSLLAQSLHALETSVPTNGDGFGLGWYNKSINEDPGLFTSITPAWHNRNLKHLAKHLISPCFFAHVRAANQGGVTEYNCHPFKHQQFLFMHNGGIGNFIQIKRPLRRKLDDDLYQWIKGETDSEHFFALFLQYVKQFKSPLTLTQMVDCLKLTLEDTLELVAIHGNNGTSYLNICISDGENLIASRITTDKNYAARSLHFTQGNRFQYQPGSTHIKKNKPVHCTIISSEILNNIHEEWHTVPVNHMISIDKNMNVKLYPF